ncbi:E3 ubiquitin-protein ligase hel2 [Capsicum annuum]|uniref:E3 ubiquitin-protein ligase hel2 n=1 Tax=Capsicum annuum TaxID=4072 RepID=UPI001FB14C9B|nr:E3 ubiquitin-protein ligase hel2 [Capsicum annuum]
MDDSCAVCAETLEWVSYGACGHKDVCSTCVARLRFICDDRRCCICKTEANVVFVTKALGDYTRMISDFSVLPSELREGRIDSYWYHEDTQAFFDDFDHYKMIREMCRLSCSVCDKMEGATGDSMRRRLRLKNIDHLKGHLFHQHKLLMCSLCLEGRKIFICEQKLYTRAQLNQHINTGDSEVDGTESERGGFMGHPLCEFCRTPFYGDNELYSHMSTEHYTCHMCQRQHPGQYEYYKNYDDLEIHFRRDHFLCEDESCLAKKFVVFQSDSELKRHNTLEHGGRMSRSQRSAALQIPTSFRYRRSNEQDNRRGRGRSFRRDNVESELSMAIQASLETANADGRRHDASSNRRVVSDHTVTDDDGLLAQPFESLTTDSEPASRYLQAVSQVSRNSQLEESSFPPLAAPPANSQPRLQSDGQSFPPLAAPPANSQRRLQSDALPKNSMASHLRRKQNKSTKPSSSSPVWPATAGHSPPVIGHQHAWPVISGASGSSSNSRHSRAAADKPSAPVITPQNSWPAVNSASGSASNSRHSRAAADKPSTPVITPQHAWPAINSASGSASGSSQIKPSTAVDGPPSSSYLNSVAVRSSLVHESSSSSVSSSRSWAHSNHISHSSSAPNLVQSVSFDSSTADFPPVSAMQSRKLPASGQQAATNVEDVQTANKSLVERMRIALEFDQDKFTAFKDISAEYRQGLMDAETYLAYAEQFGLSHLVLELARLCPDAERQKALIDTYNANLGGTVPIQNHRSGGNRLKDDKISKNGKGKSIDAGSVTSKDSTTDNILSTVRKLQSSQKIPEDDVEVLSKDGYRSAKGKSKLTLNESEEELNSRGKPLKLDVHQNDLSAIDETNHRSGNNDGKSKQRKKTSKFLRVRLGDGAVEALLNPDPDPDRKETSDEQSNPESLPVRGVWRNGGGQKLVAMTSKGPKK